MLTGSVTPEREAVLHLSIRGVAGQEEDVLAAIDTGFNGYLTLPPAVVSRLALPRHAPTSVTLADGTDKDLDVVEAEVMWDSQRRTVPALEVDGGVLVGMSLLYGYPAIVWGLMWWTAAV